MKKYHEQDRVYHRELIWQNALDLFEKRKHLTQKVILRQQKKFINNLRNNTLNINEDISDDWDCIDENIDTNNTTEQVYL